MVRRRWSQILPLPNIYRDRYPEVLNIEVKFTLDHWSDPVVQDNRKSMFKRLVDGQFPYAWPAFNAIMEKMRPASGTVVPISPLVVPRRRESPLPAAPPGQRRRNIIHISDWGCVLRLHFRLFIDYHCLASRRTRLDRRGSAEASCIRSPCTRV